MVRTLLRNRLLSLPPRFWWLVFGAQYLWVFLSARTSWPLPDDSWVPIVLCSVTYAGIFGVTFTHAALSALWEGLRHATLRHRYLCPHCLRFGEFRFARGACGHEVEAAIVQTRGAYVNDCGDCGALVYSRNSDVEGVRAFCRHCSRVCAREIHHERRVRVVAALREMDFLTLCAAIGARPVRTLGGIDSGCHDDGAQFTFILSLATVPGYAAKLPAVHALWSVEQIWLDGSDAEPLGLGEAIDRFLHRTALSEAHRRRMTLTVGGDVPDPAVHRLLSTRFGNVISRVAPATLISGERPRVPASVESAR